jgi:3-oxoacyl-[acyl-carrier protein] reductase
MRLAGKTALIAGASRNIGKTIALTFAREGANVVPLASRMSDELKQVARDCEAFGVQALPVAADVGDHEQVNRAARLALERFGNVEVLVTVAAIRPHKPFLEIGYDEWHQVLGVNLHSLFYLAKALVPAMIKSGKGGSIVALGGIASLTAQPRRAHVIASKTGLYGLIKSLALELGPHGIRANLLAPGLIATERRNPEWYREGGGVPLGMVSSKSDGTPIGREEGTPLNRKGTPQEVANAVLFLASDESSFITGDRMICAGGRYM